MDEHGIRQESASFFFLQIASPNCRSGILYVSPTDVGAGGPRGQGAEPELSRRSVAADDPATVPGTEQHSTVYWAKNRRGVNPTFP